MKTALPTCALLTACSSVLGIEVPGLDVDASTDGPGAADPCAYLEPNDTPATAAAVTAADTGPAAICAASPADRDVYRFTVPESTASVSVAITFPSENGNLDLRLLDGTGTMTLAASLGVGNAETITCPGASPACAQLTAGDHVFEVFGATPDAINAYTIALTLAPL